MYNRDFVQKFSRLDIDEFFSDKFFEDKPLRLKKTVRFADNAIQISPKIRVSEINS